MKISIIAAMDENRVIGKDNKLPWEKLPADMAWFRKHTMGKPTVMGRTTFESLPEPLKGRIVIVLTRDKDFRAQGCIIVYSVEEVIGLANGMEDWEELMVSGGESIYRQFLPLADKLYLTFIKGEFEGDASFPDYVEKEWNMLSHSTHAEDAENEHSMTFCTYERTA